MTNPAEHFIFWGAETLGTIPKSLYTLQNLKTLWLGSQEAVLGGFQGTISTEIGNLLHLEALGLSNNPLLTGTVPSELGLCKNLCKFLCYFVATDTASMLLLTNDACSCLAVLYLDGTSLTGTIPPEVCALDDKLHDWYNQEYSVMNGIRADCYPDNITLLPYIACDCCSFCCDHDSKDCHDMT
jgi:hypothetical protein